jgi:hypothetical protein
MFGTTTSALTNGHASENVKHNVARVKNDRIHRLLGAKVGGQQASNQPGRDTKFTPIKRQVSRGRVISLGILNRVHRPLRGASVASKGEFQYLKSGSKGFDRGQFTLSMFSVRESDGNFSKLGSISRKCDKEFLE